MSHNSKKTARMPAMKFPKLQKRLRMSGTGKEGGTRAALLAGKQWHTAEKGRAQNRKRFK